jgi:Fe(3+) dicitrate transport protein
LNRSNLIFIESQITSSPTFKGGGRRKGGCLKYLILLTSLFSLLSSPAQGIKGLIRDAETQQALPSVQILLSDTEYQTRSQSDGSFQLPSVPRGTYELVAYHPEYSPFRAKISIPLAQNLEIMLAKPLYEMEEVSIEETETRQAQSRLRSVEGTAIYAAKKNEVVQLQNLTANLATNNSRQVYARVPGLNIWESDGAGVQLGIGGRGLSPNRNSNFNTRQNGYDISADALGYPESYYTPPLEAIDRIEIVRGAASLQYGTQFGGMLNFRFKEGPRDKKIQLLSRQSTGSFGLFNSFNSLGGTIGQANYYGFVQYKRSDGWRPNSSLRQLTAYASVRYQLTPKLSLTPQYTHTHYLAQQAGGLTDAEFEMNPLQSKRERNWFQVDWNLLALNMDYKFNARTHYNGRSFGLIAGRDALGNLDPINQIDFGQNRDLLRDDFRNWGHESRLLHRYDLGQNLSALLIGMRYYQGLTTRQQGEGSNGSDPDFRYLNPARLEGSDFRLPSRNLSFFVENVFHLGTHWSLTPGIRFEHILTETDGYYRNRVFDLAGNVLLDEVITEQKSNPRSFVFGGLGLSYKSQRGPGVVCESFPELPRHQLQRHPGQHGQPGGRSGTGRRTGFQHRSGISRGKGRLAQLRRQFISPRLQRPYRNHSQKRTQSQFQFSGGPDFPFPYQCRRCRHLGF